MSGALAPISCRGSPASGSHIRRRTQGRDSRVELIPEAPGSDNSPQSSCFSRDPQYGPVSHLRLAREKQVRSCYLESLAKLWSQGLTLDRPLRTSGGSTSVSVSARPSGQGAGVKRAASLQDSSEIQPMPPRKTSVSPNREVAQQ